MNDSEVDSLVKALVQLQQSANKVPQSDTVDLLSSKSRQRDSREHMKAGQQFAEQVLT